MAIYCHCRKKFGSKDYDKFEDDDAFDFYDDDDQDLDDDVFAYHSESSIR